MNSRKALAAFGLILGGVLVIAACNGIGNLNTGGTQSVNTTPVGVSDARKNAERLIDNGVGKLLFIDLMQFNGGAGQFRCDPLGTQPGHVPWPSRIGGPIIMQPMKYNVVGSSSQGIASEYDWLSTAPSGETEYCLGLRTPVEPNFPQQFSQVEFNLRAVNPYAYGHGPGFDYVNTVDGNQAFFPSNDDIVPFRSLIDIAGGDVCIIVRGIDFGGPAITNTFATMNFLGPTGWVLFFRDNAYQSGRFYNLVGALKGGPRAFEDTPPAGDEGAFESAQVPGDRWDANSELPNSPYYTPGPAFLFGPCPGPIDPAPYAKPYAFQDFSNFNEVAVPAPGQGGFVIVVRRQAFNSRGVVINPNVPGPAPADILPGDILNPPPGSGYNEPLILPIAGPDEDNFAPSIPGVHEIGFSVFFTHSF